LQYERFRFYTRFEFKPSKERKEVQVAEARTLVIGFRCRDGVILAADTQLTVPGQFKYPESKLRYFNGKTFRAFFGYAGGADFSKMCIHDLMNRLHKIEVDEAEGNRERFDLREMLKDEAQRIYQRYYSPDDPNSFLSLLIAFQQEGKTSMLIKISGRDVVASRSYEFLGTGEHLARAIGGSRYKHHMTMETVLPTVIFTLAEAKKHVYGVSGNSQILLIHDNSNKFEVVDQARIEETEKAYAEFSSASQEFLLQYCDMRVQGEALDDSVEKYGKRLTIYRGRVTRYQKYIQAEIIERQRELYTLGELPPALPYEDDEREGGDE
jgi:20S proteasome alpha/beta subunit